VHDDAKAAPQNKVTSVEIPVDGRRLQGTLSLPRVSLGIVAFAHGSGSSRHSPRNVFVARVLEGAGIGTLLFDLLTATEDRDYAARFDIAMLSSRLVAATEWLAGESSVAGLPLGYFGASTGAAAALVAAAQLGPRVSAVVSRGGRPDLAGADALRRVMAPTLLIVGGEDHTVIGLNRGAYDHLACDKALEIVPGATHLFEEPGTLETVAALAAEWFRRGFTAAQDADRQPRDKRR
jgi:putative phosphoribosyl transferase